MTQAQPNGSGVGAGQNTAVQAGIGNPLLQISGSIQSSLMYVMGKLINTGIKISIEGTKNTMDSMKTQLSAATASANYQKASADKQADQMQKQAWSSVVGAGTTFVSLGAQTLACRGGLVKGGILGGHFDSSDGLNTQLSTAEAKLPEQEMLSKVANEPKNIMPGRMIVGGDGQDVLAQTTRLSAQQETRLTQLVGTAGRGGYENGDEQLISHLNQRTDSSGNNQLTKFKEDLNKTIEGTRTEISGLRNSIQTTRQKWEQMGQLASSGFQSGFKFAEQGDKREEGRANAASQIAQSTAANAAATLQAAQKMQGDGANSVEAIAQGIGAAIKAANPA